MGAGRSERRARLIAASESEFVDLIVSCSQISDHHESAVRILGAVDAKNRTGKIAEQRGGARMGHGLRDDLQEIAGGPVAAIGL